MSRTPAFGSYRPPNEFSRPFKKGWKSDPKPTLRTEIEDESDETPELDEDWFAMDEAEEEDECYMQETEEEDECYMQEEEEKEEDECFESYILRSYKQFMRS